jgi:phosphoenolpyruvate carboxylase
VAREHEGGGGGALGADLRPPPAGQTAADALIAELRARLSDLRDRLDEDPYVNPVKLLGLDLSRRLRSREDGLGTDRLEAVVQRLTLEAFRARARHLGAYLGELDPDANAARIAALIRAEAAGPDGGPVPFAAFDARLNRIAYGIVVTAHPTFSLAVELQEILAALATGVDAEGRPLDDAAREALLAEAERLPHRPPARLDLGEEHVQSLRVLRQLRAALGRVRKIALEVARELYPDDWRRLRPRLISVASWVGYDTDGRADIGWETTFAKRLAVQLDQLAHYRATVAALRPAAAAEPALAALLELLEARLDLAVKSAQDELELFDAAPPHDEAWRQRLARVSRSMAAGGQARLAAAAQLLEIVERALALAPDDGLALELCALRAELLTQGLGAARSHMRINAVQLHNAIRKTIGMEHAPDDPARRLTHLAAVERLIRDCEPVTVNFGSLIAERATAKRVFMVMAQMLKHLDAGEPIRFLIAETETAFTVLTALYFAKLFGVDDRIDISPLFETRKALERGAGIIDEALSVAPFRDYLRARGRLCVQTGFSDAGRYLGQPAAAVAIERIRLRLADVLKAHGLDGLEVVIFDTHGESIGRGSHPSSFADRLRYYDTPESRRRFAAAGIALREESSFQGGDGYLYFLNPSSTLAAVTRVLEHALGAEEGEENDPFYTPGAHVDELFAAVAAFNARLIDDPCYAALLGAFNVNMLYPTGSRSLKRQHDPGGPQAKLEHPSQLRAIPHNSILQQLGILANTIGGVGQALDKDPEGFRRLYRESPRFRRLMSMVEHAFKFTDPDVVLAYLDLFDPETWLKRARRFAREPAGQEEARAVADYLDRIDLHDRLARVYRVLHRDYMDLARALRDHRRLARETGERPIAVEPETRDNLHMLHALRLGLIQRLMLRAVRVPDFSGRHAATHDDVIMRLLRLDVEPSLALLAQIFPFAEDTEPELDYGEPATYRGDEGQSYRTEHLTIFRPIRDDYELIRRIGSGIVHHVGAVG